MNKYRQPPEVYDRSRDRTIDRERIHKALVGEKAKEIVDTTAREVVPRLEGGNEIQNQQRKAESE